MLSIFCRELQNYADEGTPPSISHSPCPAPSAQHPAPSAVYVVFVLPAHTGRVLRDLDHGLPSFEASGPRLSESVEVLSGLDCHASDVLG